MTTPAHPLPSTLTIAEARDWLRERLEDGDKCPVCLRHAQIYRWSLYSTAARALVLYYQLGGTTKFVHTTALKEHGHKGQGDATRLKYWGLLQSDRGPREDGGKSGRWRVTRRGELFALERTTIPKYVYVYDDRVLRSDGEAVTIRDCFGKKFSYDEYVRGLR